MGRSRIVTGQLPHGPELRWWEPMLVPPRRGTRFRAGDRAYLIGPYEELLAVLRQDRPAPQVPQQGADKSTRFGGIVNP